MSSKVKTALNILTTECSPDDGVIFDICPLSSRIFDYDSIREIVDNVFMEFSMQEKEETQAWKSACMKEVSLLQLLHHSLMNESLTKENPSGKEAVVMLLFKLCCLKEIRFQVEMTSEKDMIDASYKEIREFFVKNLDFIAN
jgi:hypothetical protein